MDRFKFRVWDSSANAYVTRSQFILLSDGTLIQEIGGEEVIWESTEPEFCTGLKDKKGKLIFEGDIVREVSIDEDSAMGAEFEEISVVCFGGGDYPYSFTLKHPRFYRGYALLNYGYMRQEIEIIGNIHENKDLLGEK